MPDFAVILPAAGASSRFGAGRNKLLAPLGGRSVLRRTVDAFLRRPDARWIVIAAPAAARAEMERALGDALDDQRLAICPGGDCRACSVLNALERVPVEAEWVAVHDAARPLVSQAVIDRALDAALAHGAAVPAMPVALTVKQAQGPLPAAVERTVPRDRLWAMQTPQVMRRSDLLEALRHCPVPLDQVTDDVQALELAGRPAWLVDGDEANLKITTAMDLRIAELLLREP